MCGPQCYSPEFSMDGRSMGHLHTGKSSTGEACGRFSLTPFISASILSGKFLSVQSCIKIKLGLASCRNKILKS